MTKYKSKTRLVMDKLIIDGKVYTVDNMVSLPADLSSETLAHKSNDKTFVFFGMNSPFSNFHSSPMKIDDVPYSCAEQFIQSSKASLFKDDEALSKIMLSGDPYYMKQIGSRIKGFDNDIWKNRICDVTTKVLKAKFSQNRTLKTKLLSLGNKVIGEASQDSIWGIGIGLKSVDVLDASKWSGDNVMGLALMKIRDELKS